MCVTPLLPPPVQVSDYRAVLAAAPNDPAGWNNLGNASGVWVGWLQGWVGSCRGVCVDAGDAWVTARSGWVTTGGGGWVGGGRCGRRQRGVIVGLHAHWAHGAHECSHAPGRSCRRYGCSSVSQVARLTPARAPECPTSRLFTTPPPPLRYPCSHCLFTPHPPTQPSHFILVMCPLPPSHERLPPISGTGIIHPLSPLYPPPQAAWVAGRRLWSTTAAPPS